MVASGRVIQVLKEIALRHPPATSLILKPTSTLPPSWSQFTFEGRQPPTPSKRPLLVTYPHHRPHQDDLANQMACIEWVVQKTQWLKRWLVGWDQLKTTSCKVVNFATSNPFMVWLVPEWIYSHSSFHWESFLIHLTAFFCEHAYRELPWVRPHCHVWVMLSLKK